MNFNIHKDLLPVILLFMSICNAFAQPANYVSQYHLNHSLINPSRFGVASDLQIQLMSRKQWLNADLGYLTSAVSITNPLFRSMESGKHRYGGLNLSILQEQSGTNRMLQTSEVMAGFSYNIGLSNKHSIGLGLQTMYYHQRINLRRITTDNQYAGHVFDPTVSNGELLKTEGDGTLVYNTGLSWMVKGDGETTKAWLGIAAQNIGQSKLSLLTETSDVPLILITDGGWRFQSGERFFITPTFRIISQVNVLNYYTLGSLVHYQFFDEKMLMLGTWYSPTGNSTFSVGYDSKKMNLSIAYDLPVWSDESFSKAANSVELNLMYRINKR